MDQAINNNFISPFSFIDHKWEIMWIQIPSATKYDKPNENRSEKENAALEAISCVGVIGGLQLQYLFGLSREHIKRMCEKHLLVRHTLYKTTQDGKSQEIPIYTVGRFGANNMMPEYKDNYWIELDTKKVLKALLFFQFCQLFKDIEIAPAPEPFTASIYLNDQLYYIYVERDGLKDLTLYLKWKKNFKERIFVVTENIQYLKELEMFIEEQSLKLRAVVDEHLKKREFILWHFNDKTREWITS
ncbi:hypothetical protein JCM21714_2126 [Gracilibacillus boraciitolerans JCM 21714]|uniref:Uncharacterized protein n=1 Tax=Gracilibacillus boraciitolerans JCM 21714 TaxID=1298598 RepID=W4VJZ5_9BACI|nr:hypothetical protein [Gracilibacillus boraciitolerans]GAE93089.1 hypothetical protein JCM21714_2126 [Gracilibacillus boraciitolerans JCM 21714]